MIEKIILIGAVGGKSPYQEAEIRRLLAMQVTSLAHGKSFTGRVGTQIYTDEKHLVKIRGELKLDAHSAQRWAAQALAKEQDYKVHHPDKTWFVAIDESQNLVLIGNICPHLKPVHTIIQRNAEVEAVSVSQRLDYLRQAFMLYFRLASQLNIRLDEGLSNFGVTADNCLYYLDDDFYGWDRFISCAHMIGVYIRSLSWLRNDVASEFGTIIHELIIDHFNDSQYLTVLAEQMRDVFMPAAEQQAALSAFVTTLKTKPNASTKPAPVAPKAKPKNTRYFALLADVHGNLPALEVALDFLKKEGIDQGIVLGDVVGYGPHPTECIKRLQDSQFIVLKGNHDHGLASGNFTKGFSSTASWVLKWSQDRVSDEDKEWLLDLPSVWYEDNWMAVHGAPIDPTFFNAYVYEMTYHDNLDVLARKSVSYCFHGHTHQPGAYLRKNIRDQNHKAQEIDLKNYEHALICPGSIGQPRNRQPGSQFAIYDRQEQKLTYHCLPYDVEALIKEMSVDDFPNTLVKLLRGEM